MYCLTGSALSLISQSESPFSPPCDVIAKLEGLSKNGSGTVSDLRGLYLDKSNLDRGGRSAAHLLSALNSIAHMAIL